MTSPTSPNLDPASILYGDSLRKIGAVRSWPHEDRLDNLVSDLIFTGEEVKFWSLERYCTGFEQAVKNRSLHNDDGPAVEWDDGCWSYYKRGYLHREDGPASHNLVPWDIWRDCWSIEGMKHRDGDLPAVVRSSGDNEWWQYGLRHRDGSLPALIFHPRFSPRKTVEWWRHGDLITSLEVSNDGWIALNDEPIPDFEALQQRLMDAGLMLPEPEKYSEPWDQ